MFIDLSLGLLSPHGNSLHSSIQYKNQDTISPHSRMERVARDVSTITTRVDSCDQHHNQDIKLLVTTKVSL